MYHLPNLILTKGSTYDSLNPCANKNFLSQYFCCEDRFQRVCFWSPRFCSVQHWSRHVFYVKIAEFQRKRVFYFKFAEIHRNTCFILWFAKFRQNMFYFKIATHHKKRCPILRLHNFRTPLNSQIWKTWKHNNNVFETKRKYATSEKWDFEIKKIREITIWEFGIWRPEFGIWSLESRVWRLDVEV